MNVVLAFFFFGLSASPSDWVPSLDPSLFSLCFPLLLLLLLERSLSVLAERFLFSTTRSERTKAKCSNFTDLSKSLLSWNACVKFEENLRKVDERVKFMWTSNFQMQLLCKNKTQIGSFKPDPIFSSMLLWTIYRDKLEMLTDDVYIFLKLSLDNTWQIRSRCHTASLLSLCCHGPFKRITLQ